MEGWKDEDTPKEREHGRIKIPGDIKKEAIVQYGSLVVPGAVTSV